jgi:phenylpyruvate tautomerase PptA (4-oxalocrotonate tautomerase family)
MWQAIQTVLSDVHEIEGANPMPMIDVYAAEGTFAAKKDLTKALTAAMMRWEGVPPISLFKDNTAAFIHDLEPDALGNANGDSNYVRVQILTPLGVLNRDKQLGVVKEMTDIVASAAGDPSLGVLVGPLTTRVRASPLATAGLAGALHPTDPGVREVHCSLQDRGRVGGL